MSGKTSTDERRRRVAESMQVGNPGDSARIPTAGPDVPAETQLDLTVDDIRPYELNPRRADNPKFDDIKESIRTSGLRSPLTVTRRPGESHFIVDSGGNTRLLALRQLWAETRDPRYRTLTVLFRPWRSESYVLTAHLVENEQRGDMTFWDKAAGIVALKERLEQESGKPLSLRPLEDALHGLGLAVNTATLAHYLFALQRLRILGEGVPKLSGLDVKTLQPRLNALKRYAQSQSSMSEDEIYAQVFEPTFRQTVDNYRRTGMFTGAAVGDACEVALAVHLGGPPASLCTSVQGQANDGRAALAQSDTNERPAEVSAVTSPPLEPSWERRTADLSEDPVVHAARTFAASVGLADCIGSGAGSQSYLVTEPSVNESVSPEHRFAWWLMAGIVGQLPPDSAPPRPFTAEFLTWLVKSDDASSNAFWALLSALRARLLGSAASTDGAMTLHGKGPRDAAAP